MAGLENDVYKCNRDEFTLTAPGQYIQVNDGTDEIKHFISRGSPQGVVTADTGSQANDSTNGDIYVKTTDGTNTGWKALAGAGGAWTYISSATASNSASVSFTDLSSTYSAYLVQVIDVQPVNDAGVFAMRTSSNNGASYDSGLSDYRYSGVVSGSSLNQSYSTGYTSIIFNAFASQGNDTNEFASLNVQILSPSSINYTTVQAVLSTANTSGVFRDTRMSGQRKSAAAVDAIQFFYLNGNISVGTFRLYGLSAT